MVLDARSVEKMRAVILSDGKKGHLNQSIAFCKHLGVPYEIVEVAFRSRFAKALGYLFDWLGIYTKALLKPFDLPCGDLVVSAGSSTYYANKLIAKRCRAKSIALMQPKGFRKNFDLLFAQRHDGGELPVNFSYLEPAGLVKLSQGDVAVVIGGPNRVYEMKEDEIKAVLDYIFANFKGKKAVTTAPRTPKRIEELVESYPWDYKVIYSKNPINPLGDFVQAEYLFVTMDSTSMISEAVSAGRANVEVVPLRAKRANKYEKMVRGLAKEGYLHIFDGRVAKADKKFYFSFVKDLF